MFYLPSFFSSSYLTTVVLLLTKLKKPGCHLPWRVTHVKATTPGRQKQKQKQKQKPPTAQKRSLLENKDIASCLKKKNLGKKRRIILRKALAAQEAAKDADQEKRARRNREKKVKRKQKEKEKKAAAAAAAAGGGGGDAPGASGSPGPGTDTLMGGVGSDSGSE